MTRNRLRAMTAIAALVLAGSGTFATAAGNSAGHDDRRAPSETKRQRLADIALPAGLQVARKHKTLPQVQIHGKTVNAANPYLGEISDPASVDYAYWSRYLARKSARQQPTGRTLASLLYEEQEPSGDRGSNDVQPNAERIADFGRGGGKTPVVNILGELSPPQLDTVELATEEDQGSIPLATETGIPADTEGVEVSSEIGDGPHGSDGDATGDFDFFKVTASDGQSIQANTAGSEIDTILVVYDADGNILAANDDANGTLQSDLKFKVPEAGNYFVLVTGFLSLPEDPFDSGSGLGVGAEGPYNLVLGVGFLDTDYYGVKLRAGDVLGGTLRGQATDIVVHKVNGALRVGSFQDASFIYPIETPLPGGGHADFAYVAEQAGWYAVSTEIGEGDYRMTLEVYRPGSGSAGPGVTQKIFLDFDGERVNTAIFGGGGVSQLSPLSAFVGRWGLPSSSLDQVINRIVATVKENVQSDLAARGLNDNFNVKILNSRDNPDKFGDPNVSRVIVGGTIAQSGVFTIGVAQSIDPGNYAHQETALVLLDILSDSDPDEDASLNFYITPQSNKVKFIGTAIGNVTSHEIGHYLGSFHVDQFNDRLNLMDQGGNFPLLFGVGDDGIGGTADDPDVDFGIDDYNPNEGFTGFENTLNNSAWGLVLGH
jgi:hypothetical protein